MGAATPGESLQGIVRDQWIGEIHRLGIETINFARFYGASGDNAFFQHMLTGEAIICEDVDTVVGCFAPKAAGYAHPIGEKDPDVRCVRG